jgi:hypothetical protein
MIIDGFTGRVMTIDPKGILFTLPSINDDPPKDGGPVDGSEFAVAEDDWRQLEFVHLSHREVIEEELLAISRIYEEHSQGFGFNDIHVRSRLVEPISEAQLTADALVSLGLEPMRLLCFDGHVARIEGGFAYPLSSDWTLYGVVTKSYVETLAFAPTLGALAEAKAVAVEEFARKHELLLVDWCRCAVGKPGTDVFREIVARTV